jgi:hypothetical protein
MFHRSRAGSLYWLAARDGAGAYLDGGKSYRLSIPQPVRAELFWSVTAYDAQTRSEIETDQDKAALRSMFELKDVTGDKPVELYFGPAPPVGRERRWIKTAHRSRHPTPARCCRRTRSLQSPFGPTTNR